MEALRLAAPFFPLFFVALSDLSRSILKIIVTHKNVKYFDMYYSNIKVLLSSKNQHSQKAKTQSGQGLHGVRLIDTYKKLTENLQIIYLIKTLPPQII